MYSVARLSKKDLRILFRNTAMKKGINEAIVEKDFWVCLTLDYLFHSCKWSNSFTFKGGTSLSKCFNLISRFSEDIDIILDWRTLDYGMNEPWEDRSNNQQDKFNKTANLRAEAFLREFLLPTLIKDMSDILGEKAVFYIDDNDSQTICFDYPRIFNTPSVLQIIRLEIGALAAWTPSLEKTISPYAAEFYPKVFEQGETKILTVAPERTFWEKATILHHEANRPETLDMPLRYSRHYYDLYCIAHSENKKIAFQNKYLLEKVVQFKMKFYPRKWAKYEEACIGGLRLVPPTYRLPALKEDYENMKDMMFGEYPKFSELMAYIEDLEKEINSL